MEYAVRLSRLHGRFMRSGNRIRWGGILPHETFAGSDAQLKAALDLLKEEIRSDPRPVPALPPHPNKAFPYRP
jgi:hypothetical protein